MFSIAQRSGHKFTSFKVLVINVRYSKSQYKINILTLQFILNQFKRF